MFLFEHKHVICVGVKAWDVSRWIQIGNFVEFAVGKHHCMERVTNLNVTTHLWKPTTPYALSKTQLLWQLAGGTFFMCSVKVSQL